MDPVAPITSNLVADNTSRILSAAFVRLRETVARLSSGSKLSSPSADPAGLAQFAKFDAQISRLDAVDVNVGNAISFAQTQDGTLQVVQQAVDRIGELTIRAQDPTLTDSDRANFQAEVTQLQDFVNDATGQTFNGQPLFSASGFQVTTDSDGSSAALAAINLGASGSSGGIGDLASVSVATSAAAASALDTVKTATDNLSKLRANVGANLQRLNVTSETAAISQQNLLEAASRLNDVDFAQESTELGLSGLLVQSGTANLVRANLLPQSTLSLVA